MIDYFETKSQPITRAMVIKAYREVRSKKGSGGVDNMSWKDLEKDVDKQLYKLWNRLSSGSYFPLPVKEVEISKKDGGVRKLGIPTLIDRIAQQVVKAHLETIAEPRFHKNSFGYRPGKSCHDAVKETLDNMMNHDWVIDLDIKSFFDEIDHELMGKALRHYCKDKWVLLYVERWLKAGVLKRDGNILERTSGTPQGGVISPLLANIFLHVVFDKWMENHHPDKPFVRYADDIVVHCKTEKQARYVIARIKERLKECRLAVHPDKTRIVNMRGITSEKHPRRFDFLGFTFKPALVQTTKGKKLMVMTYMSKRSMSAVLDKFRTMQIHKKRKSIVEVAKELNPITRGIINYYCKSWVSHTNFVWYQLNLRLWKWVKWEKGLYARKAARYLKTLFKEKPNLFYHWKIEHP